MTQNISFRKDTPRSYTAFLNRAVDLVCAFSLTFALLLWLFPVAGLSFSMGSCLLAAIVSLIVVAVLSLRWWIVPAITALLLLTGAAFVLLFWWNGSSPGQLLLMGMDFVSSLPETLAQKADLSTEMASFPLQFLLALLVCAFVWAFLRKFFSYLLLFALCAGESAFLWAGGYDTAATALLFCLFTLVLCLPRIFFRELQGKEKGDKDKKEQEESSQEPALPDFLQETSKKKVLRGKRKSRELTALIPRYTLQGMALPVALLCVVATGLIIPEDTSSWRSSFLVNIITDINDYFDLIHGNFYPYDSFSIASSGYMPLGEGRLGGPVRINNITVLQVQTDGEPFFLRGGVQDHYTGQGWEDSRYSNKFRWDSLLWRGQRKEQFDPALPLGGKQAEQLAREMTTKTTVDIEHRSSQLPVLFSSTQVDKLKHTFRKNQESYFNLQSELFLDGPVLYPAVYRLEGSYYDRGLPDFTENMLELETLAYAKSDPAYEEIMTDYLQLPEELPQEIFDLTAQITQDIDSPYLKAEAIEQWISDYCHYTLTPSEPDENQDFVLQFLQSKEGYCTYYATAMSVMARCAGLPSRYVIGYGLRPSGSGQYNYRASNANAHAWCEIYFSGIGWISFDPVSWEEAVSVQQEMLEAKKKETPKAPSATYVPILPEEEPEPILPDLPETEKTGKMPKQRATGLMILIIAAVSLILILLACFGLFPYLCDRIYRRYDRRYVRLKYPERADAAEYYYRDILRQLAFFDRAPGPGDTIRTFSLRADERIESGPITMEEIGDIMTALRFGGVVPQVSQIDRMERYHNRLEDQIRQRLSTAKYFFTRVLPSFRQH